MATFVHLADERSTKKIIINGIKVAKHPWRKTNGVFAMPVTSNYYVTHQWQRELKRRGIQTFVGIQFRIPDDEPVLVGKYNEEQIHVSASVAVGIVLNHQDGEGLEVIIPRKILPKEIRRHYHISKNVGWRYFPGSHGKKPCGCSYCQRGNINSRNLRTRY